MQTLSRIVTNRYLIGISVVGLISIGSVVVADIFSGTSTVGSSSNVTITQLDINKPAAVAVGDLMLASIAVNGGSPANVTAPSGWTLVLRTDNDTNVSVLSYWKIAGASEPSSYTWTINSQTRAVGGITPYSGIDASNPIDTSAGAADRSTTGIAPSITTTVGNTQIVTVFAYNAGTTNGDHFATPAGMTEKYDTTNTPFGPSIASHDAVQPTAGASGAKSSDLGSGPQRNWAAQQIALRPAVTTLFSDDFHRPNSSVTGNGWTDVCAGSGAFLGISDNHYFQNWNVNGGCSTFRTDIAQLSGVAISSQVSFSNNHAAAFEVSTRAQQTASGAGYGVALHTLDNTVSIISADGGPTLASVPFTFALNDVYQVEIDITNEPQNWMYVYVWNVTQGESKPATPTVQWTNGGTNYTPLASGTAYSMTGHNSDATTQANVYLFEVNTFNQ